MSSERKSVRVTIYNQPYTLGVADDAAEVEALAQSVDELMTGIAVRAGNVDGARIAVMACLHLADQLRGTERELSALKSGVGAKTQEFSALLDSALDQALQHLDQPLPADSQTGRSDPPGDELSANAAL